MLIIVVGIVPGIVVAEKSGSILECVGVECNTWKAFIQSVNNFIDFLFRIAIGLSSISIAYAGFLYLTASGDEGKVKKAHGIFWMILKGFLFMLSAWVIVKLVLRLAGPEYSLLE